VLPSGHWSSCAHASEQDSDSHHFPELTTARLGSIFHPHIGEQNWGRGLRVQTLYLFPGEEHWCQAWSSRHAPGDRRTCASFADGKRLGVSWLSTNVRFFSVFGDTPLRSGVKPEKITQERWLRNNPAERTETTFG